MLTGEAVKAPDALAMGLITEVAPKGGALEHRLVREGCGTVGAKNILDL
ncbi:hypothetical protein [Rhodoplanes sp. SY1]